MNRNHTQQWQREREEPEKQKNTLSLPRGPWLGLSSAVNSPGNVKSPWIQEHSSLQHPHQQGQGDEPCGAQSVTSAGLGRAPDTAEFALGAQRESRLCLSRLSQLSFAHQLSPGGLWEPQGQRGSSSQFKEQPQDLPALGGAEAPLT